MAREDSFDIFGADPFGRDIIYGLSSGNDGMGLAPYGTRYSESVNQPITAKGRGYLGNVGTIQDPMTELSASSDFGGRTVQYPLVVPTLNADELNLLRSGGEPTQDIYSKAQQFALDRLSRGLDPFATTQELRYPQPQGLNPAPSTDRVQESPRGFISGLFSDVLGGTLNMPSMPRTGIPSLDLLYANRNPLFNLMGVGDVQKTAERISYGQPLTTGSGMTLRPREETIFAGMAVAPLVGEAVNLGTRAGRAGARMVGQGIAENVAMGRSSLPSLLAEPKPSLFAVEPNAMMPKPQAPVSELGFYSAAEQAAMNLQRNKGTGQAFLNDLMKAPDVKKDELSWIGLDDFLKDKPNVTKQEVQDFIASNKIDLQEVRLGGDLSPELQTTRDALNDKYKGLVDNIADAKSQFEEGKISYGQLRNTVSNNQIQIQALDTQINEINKTIPPTKYQKYQLAGGENYREILLKLPQKETRTPNMIEYEKLGQQMFGGALNPTERARLDELENLLSREERSMALSGGKSKTSVYQSSHFNEPNILAHIRVNDRLDADGKKMLLVEEIQSDWHQAGREKGYKGKGTLKELPDNYFVQEIKTIDGDTMYVVRDSINPSVIINKDYNRQSAINGVINELNASSAGGVPDAPFKDTWYQLALKRIMKYAADNGYERVGLTTGKRQIERFSDELRQNVDQIDFTSGYPTKDTTTITATKNGQPTFEGNVVDGKFIDGAAKGKTIDEVLGKSIAQKIQSHDPSQGLGTIKGDDLTIGGEGMKKYYDEIYPKFLEKYGKKWDASVGETKLNVTRDPALKDMKSRPVGVVKSDYGWSLKLKDGSSYGAFSTEESALKKLPEFQKRFEGNGEPIRYIDITPKMKEGVKKGQPLASTEQAPEILASGGLDYADPFRNPLTESTIG